jgi:hypothetical protein
MNVTAFHKQNKDLVTGKGWDYEEHNFTIMLHLLVLTRMNRWVCKESFKEFLIRLFLIRDQPVQDSFELFLENEVLISGELGEKHFEFTLSDLLAFTGFAREELKFHVWGTTDEFIRDYQKITYDVWAEESEAGELLDTSEDFFLMTSAMNYDLYEIQNLSLNFKKDLSTLIDQEFSEINRLVEFLSRKVPKEFFSEYQHSNQKILKEYNYAFTDQDTLFFDPLKEFYPARIRKILEFFIPKDNPSLRAYLNNRGSADSVTNELRAFLKYIKFGFGVKYGLIHLSENPADFQSCFDPRFENGELASSISDEFGSSTSEIFNRCRMVFWLHLLPKT